MKISELSIIQDMGRKGSDEYGSPPHRHGVGCITTSSPHTTGPPILTRFALSSVPLALRVNPRLTHCALSTRYNAGIGAQTCRLRCRRWLDPAECPLAQSCSRNTTGRQGRLQGQYWACLGRPTWARRCVDITRGAWHYWYCAPLLFSHQATALYKADTSDQVFSRLRLPTSS